MDITISPGHIARVTAFSESRQFTTTASESISEARFKFKAPNGKVFVFVFLGAIDAKLVDDEYETAVNELVADLGIDLKVNGSDVNM